MHFTRISFLPVLSLSYLRWLIPGYKGWAELSRALSLSVKSVVEVILFKSSASRVICVIKFCIEHCVFYVVVFCARERGRERKGRRKGIIKGWCTHTHARLRTHTYTNTYTKDDRCKTPKVPDQYTDLYPYIFEEEHECHCLYKECIYSHHITSAQRRGSLGTLQTDSGSRGRLTRCMKRPSLVHDRLQGNVKRASEGRVLYYLCPRV